MFTKSIENMLLKKIVEHCKTIFWRFKRLMGDFLQQVKSNGKFVNFQNIKKSLNKHCLPMPKKTYLRIKKFFFAKSRF